MAISSSDAMFHGHKVPIQFVGLIAEAMTNRTINVRCKRADPNAEQRMYSIMGLQLVKIYGTETI